MRSVLALAFAGAASAHFILLNPKSFFFDDDLEGQAPCGGKLPDFPSNDNDLFQYHIGGEDIATQLTHERSDWLIRVTTDQTGSKGWEEVFPIYTQSGLGSFCQPKVAIPSKYEGKTGIVSVVSAATDGFLYQCALVKFVPGTGESFGKCSNGSATGYFSSNAKLSAMVGDSADSTPAPNETPASTSASAPAQTSKSSGSDKDDSALSLQAWGFMSSMVTVAAMVAAGGAFLV
ncbi:hypothetical protein NLU13_2498 [Sarocladium strictum]|uniref:Copper acquisition factor BIM1-like domain-containing protein n=1 Tax=Sarocladium strictum TaxID=5046 RepID=A0AA39L8W7_SARSR|nr:hypothetical protein NLU13_2498 [Sarocladium strictum]